MRVQRTDIRIYADDRKVLLRYLNVGLKEERVLPILNYVRTLTTIEIESELDRLNEEFGHRHFDLNRKFLEHFDKVSSLVKVDLNQNQKLLLGSYFTHEYSIQASALFNPSIVPHPDQSGMKSEELRFIMSFRATGEGHISSVVFNSGSIDSNGQIKLDKASEIISEGEITHAERLNKHFVNAELGVENELSKFFPELCTLTEVKSFISSNGTKYEKAKDLFESAYDIQFENNSALSSRILFPFSSKESMGMEDVRFVKFNDKREAYYVGTYTAYNGREIKPHIIITKDFIKFSVRPMVGQSAINKGPALFPRKIEGKYVMIGRQDARSLSIMYSDNLLIWKNHVPLQNPQRGWEMLQIGNNGSPIEIEEGWLLLTHAVGPMRKYTLSMTLLDKNDPSIVIASLDNPLMSPNEEEREGYVPNVLYTCGMIAHNRVLYIPYAMSDSAVSFATVSIEELLKDLLP